MKIDRKNIQVREQTDVIWDLCLNISPTASIPQFQKQLVQNNILAAARDRLVLQEVVARDVRLLELRQPDQAQLPTAVPSNTLVSQGTPVLVIHEYFDWYLIAVMSDPWSMGWVEKNAVRMRTDFILRVNDEHYLETMDGRHFPRIAPYVRGYGDLMKELDPKTDPPKYNIKYIIMHCTTGARMESTINHFRDPASGVSTHLLIGRDGRVVQFVPFNRIAHHAGHSWWETEKHLNNFSIGIELDNAGRLRPGKDEDRDVWMSRKTIIPDDRMRKAAHWKRPTITDVAWETYPPIQIEVAWKIVKALKEKYGIQEILGHDDVNLLNREDPGPLLTDTLQEWRQKLFGRSLPAFKTFYLTKATDLLRNFGLALPNESTSLHEPSILPADSEVTLLGKYDPTDVWTKISVKQYRKAQELRNRTGWVRTNSLVPIEGKGQKGGRQMGNDKSGGKAGSRNLPPRPIVIRQFHTKNDQPFYKIAGGEPTPRVDLEPGMKVRRQEVNGKWMQVVVLDPIDDEIGVQGWVKWEPELWSETMPKPETRTMPAIVRSNGVPLWRHKDDRELGRDAPERERYPTPEVFPMNDRAMAITKQWQFFICAINYEMYKKDPKKVSAILGSRRAFTNRKGFNDPDLPPRADYVLSENLDCPDPEFDRVRTCALSVMTGRLVGQELIVDMLNGSQPPPLKEGRRYPERVEDINIDDYLYNPGNARHYFFAANIINGRGETVPFPNGASYPDWTGDQRPYTWLPHVAPGGIRVRYPLSKLVKLPPAAPIPSPYKARDDRMD